MKNNVLSYAEYQKRIKELKTPEDIAAFAQELIAPALAGAGAPEDTEAKTVEMRSESPVQAETPQKRIPLPKEKLFAIRKAEVADASVITPWYDVVNSDTEAMAIGLYAKGLTTRDISSYLKNMHGIEIAQPSISAITDKVFPLVKEWQTRSLSACYPVVYLDGLHFKVRDAGKIASKVAYIVLGINQYGQKEVLGIWVGESEGAKFWMHVLSDMKNRGVDDILIACVDGLKGFPEAIKAVFPHADVQVCIAHQIRHTIMFIPHKDKKRFCDELKSVYTAPTEEAGMDALKAMMDRWPQYRSYLKSWETRWSDLAPFFGYPEPVRRMVYTTNAIENLNRQFRKVTKTTTVFPHDDALIKLLWLAQADITQAWVLTTRNWGEVMAQLNILFPDRVHF
ncbi:IS256 family transposase [Patescibacteria group bacterium]|nr:IS256 family transposase [Patescibacteria group bacterium]MDL1953143.1 IS256 family transposase [Candidatus Uhrbacteria bacterium UHB]RIL00401.1 MAG: IS256 family transposase [Candidatus Uhrbacteria bacterium]